MSKAITKDPVLNRILTLSSFCLIAITGLAARLSLMRAGLTGDESWVANSVLAPALREMFYYPRWLQTSPPLFLLLLRCSTLLGKSELVLRLAPCLAGAASVVLMGMALKRLFRSGLAILGTLFLATNYWAIKYSGQAKQYTMDLFVSALLLFLLLRYLEHNPSRRLFWALILTGTVGIFLSYATIFWFPVVFVAVAISGAVSGPSLPRIVEKGFRRLSVVDLAIPLVAYSISFALLDRFFIRRNRLANLTEFWKNDFMGSGGSISSAARFLVIFCDVMVPQHGSHWFRLTSFVLGMVVFCALVRAVIAANGGDRRARNVLIVTTLPTAVALVVSSFREYPLLSPRMLIWVLPLCTVLLVYAAEPLWRILTIRAGDSKSIAVAFGATVLVCSSGFYLYCLMPRSYGQDARSAIVCLKNGAGSRDQIFVRGELEEEFIYYSELLQWSAPSRFVGNADLPCCLRSPQVVRPNLTKASFASDIRSFSQIAAGKRAWFLLSSYGYQRMQHTIWTEMVSAGCQNIQNRDFEGVTLALFDCTSSFQVLPPRRQ